MKTETLEWIEEDPAFWKIKLPREGNNVVARISATPDGQWFWETWPWRSQWGVVADLEEAKKLAKAHLPSFGLLSSPLPTNP